ncbi:SGF29 tudor-like domain-containing protein [Roridomyces roridus]|uniref:SGF29 tudor-like domain-containing protein n=1 Tax=Roridomyces roridus TaxID=1738132 RepID=A0AAD7CAW9_9AGAR|nr:SGF29 tudor-like domain-containing protein [Roridomyces roridus]
MRRTISTRPASSEGTAALPTACSSIHPRSEFDCWSHAATSLKHLSSIYSTPASAEAVPRVNRLISVWPADETLPAQGLDNVKQIYRKLSSGLEEIKATSEREVKAIEDTIERLDVLIALRKAPESAEKRMKRPRPPSPSSTPVPAAQPIPAVTNRVSITLPARNSVGPSSATTFSREPKARREALARQLPLQEGRKVAFHQPSGKPSSGGKPSGGGGNADTGENWILAVVKKCLNGDKNRYEVQDPEPQEDGQPGLCYNTTLRAIIPLPDPNASPGSPSHLSSYQDFLPGSTVMALYPDTSCFYRAEVISTPKHAQQTGRMTPSSKHIYKLKFEDDDGQEHSVSAEWVVEWPGS